MDRLRHKAGVVNRQRRSGLVLADAAEDVEHKLAALRSCARLDPIGVAGCGPGTDPDGPTDHQLDEEHMAQLAGHQARRLQDHRYASHTRKLQGLRSAQ